MQKQPRKKKKPQNHKVTLATDKLSKDCYKLPNVENAYFPYQPYPEQSILISKIHQCIKNQQNVLVESPTGTGKTLCMLVATLSCLCSITETGNSKVPKIYYLTRTHSQITQVINQLKRTPWYQCKINIIASREHLCINRNLKELKGRALDRGCQQMCKQKLCKYKQALSDNILPIKQWLTLEQLCQKGNKKNFCPFYFSKMSTEKCQLTIMPFNYLLDWSLFQHNNFNLKNSVIIFDQAHNVDSLAEQGSSLQIDTELLTQTLIQVKNLQQSSKCRYLHKKFQSQNQSSDNTYISQVKGLILRMNSVLREYNQQKNYSNADEMLSIIKRLTNFVMNQQQVSGVDLNNYEQYEIIFDKVKKMFYQKKIDSSQFQLFCSIFMKMMKMLDSNTLSMEDYYMYVGPKSSRNYTLKFICLNASFTFKRILQQKPRSIILCSGTLGPFQILQNELGMNFTTKLKIPSFISPQQICVAIVDQNYKKSIKYQFSFQNKSRQQQFESFGQQLRQIQKVIPNGIVVAFSTYELMQKSMKFCIGLKKPVFYESKNENIQKIYSKYVQLAKSDKGAFLFIVMKGKFSQGINFNDQLCRCLIVVGIPFLPPNDYKIIKKKAYLINKFDRQASQQWYYSQTFKSVNQVIGRVIRSKKDYGCVLLFDLRYSRKDILKQLPSWFVNNISYQNRTDYLSKIRKFFVDQRWLSNHSQNSKKQLLQSSFQLAISKTIISNQQSNRLSLEALLNEQTPVKIKNQRGKTKPKQIKKNIKDKQQKHIKLKIISDDQSSSSNQQTKIDTKYLQNDKKTQKIKRPQRPWLSIDYFIGQQIKQFVKESKNKQSTSQQVDIKIYQNQQNKAILTMHSNKKRNHKYI